MNEQDLGTTSTTPHYDPEAVIVTMNGLDPKPAYVKAWQLSSTERAYWALMGERNEACAKIESAWQVVLDNKDNMDEELVTELAEALGKKLTGTVEVTITIGTYGYETVEFTLDDVPLDTDLTELAEKIEEKTSVKTKEVEVSVVGYLFDGSPFTDEAHEVDHDVDLDGHVEVSVSCTWE